MHWRRYTGMPRERNKVMPETAPLRSSDRFARERNDSGFTLVEIVIVVAIIGLLAGLAGTSYARFLEEARIARAIAEISQIGTVIDALRAFDESPPPDSLAQFDLKTPIDPWGNTYHYLRIEGVFDVAAISPEASGLPAVSASGGGETRPTPTDPRKDRFFKPISTDYDLYSSGPDGVSRDSLEHRDSRDDVVRALNGKYFGLAERF